MDCKIKVNFVYLGLNSGTKCFYEGGDVCVCVKWVGGVGRRVGGKEEI